MLVLGNLGCVAVLSLAETRVGYLYLRPLRDGRKCIAGGAAVGPAAYSCSMLRDWCPQMQAHTVVNVPNESPESGQSYVLHLRQIGYRTTELDLNIDRQ